MKYYAKLISIDENVEEEVIFAFGEYNICCFIDYSPVPLRVGNIYLVELGLWFNDDMQIETSKDKHFFIKRERNTFQHIINGYLFEDKLVLSNLIFEDELFYDFSYFEKDFITIKPDRITVSIIEQ